MIGLPFGLLTGEPARLAKCCSVFAGDSNSGQTFAGFQVRRTGDVWRRSGSLNPWTMQCDYVTAGKEPTVGDEFEIKVEGTGHLDIDAGLGVWLALTSTRSWAISENPGQFRMFNGTYQIREIAVPSNISSTCSLNFDTEDGS